MRNIKNGADSYQYNFFLKDINTAEKIIINPDLWAKTANIAKIDSLFLRSVHLKPSCLTTWTKWPSNTMPAA